MLPVYHLIKILLHVLNLFCNQSYFLSLVLATLRASNSFRYLHQCLDIFLHSETIFFTAKQMIANLLRSHRKDFQPSYYSNTIAALPYHFNNISHLADDVVFISPSNDTFSHLQYGGGYSSFSRYNANSRNTSQSEFTEEGEMHE